MIDQKLPAHWKVVSVREAGTVQLGRQRSPEHHQGPHMRPYLRVANVQEARIYTDDVKQMNFTPAEYERFKLEPEDILLNEGQSLDAVGRSAMYRGEVPGACFQNTLVRFRAGPLTTPSWALLVFRYCLHDGVFQRIAKWTTNMAHLGAGRFAELPFPLPPIEEQLRIVAVVDTLESDMNAGANALQRVLLNLKRYRAAVLTDAYEGRLVPTEAEIARAEGREYEPADVLLQRILGERRMRWETEHLTKKNSKVLEVRNERWKTKYVEPQVATASERPDPPEGWTEAPLGSISAVQLGQQRAPIHTAADVTYPYIRAGNITWQGLSLIDVKQMGFPDPERYRLEPGDILLSEASGSPSEVGKPAIWRGEIPNCCYQKTLLRVRTYSTGLAAEWLHLGFMRDAVLGLFAKMAPGVGILHLTAERMLEWPVRLPPLAEQRRIIAEVDRLLSVADTTEQAARGQLARARRLRQAILKQAFEGKLAPQDASHEPASVKVMKIEPPKTEGRPASPTLPIHLVPSQVPSFGEVLREFRAGERLSPQAFASRFEIEIELVAKLESIAIPFDLDQALAMRKTIRAALPALGVAETKMILDELAATLRRPATEEEQITLQAARKAP